MHKTWQVFVVAAVAMVAFASNSLLNRFALDSESIDAATFSTIRLIAGAITLGLLVALRRHPPHPRPQIHIAISATMLFVYAAAFSFAYLRIGAGTGALLLFGVVQTVMYGTAIARGERPGPLGWLGLSLAGIGVAALVAPGASAPDPAGAALMAIAGLAWAVYTLRGRGATDPLAVTSQNFIWAVPLAVMLEFLVLALAPTTVQVEPRGVVLAILSGALASGVGYALWYAVLPRLSGVQAGIIQMSPAPLAVIGGLLLLGEAIITRVVLASVLVLAGVAVGLAAPKTTNRNRKT